MMELADSKQTRIFAPFTEKFQDNRWREEILGDIVKPLIAEFSDHINWFWFSKYIQGSEGNADIGDTDFEQIRNSHRDCLDGNGLHRSIRFRVNAKEGHWESIRTRADELIRPAGAVITDWRDYPVVEDLGSNRFAPEHYSDEQRKERAYLIAKLYESISRVTLATLVRKEERWRLEYDVNSGNVSDSLHHLFCNISDTSPMIKVETRGGRIYLSNASYPDMEITSGQFQRVPF